MINLLHVMNLFGYKIYFLERLNTLVYHWHTNCYIFKKVYLILKFESKTIIY